MKPRRGNPSPRPPSSGGIPTSESLWMPKHYGAVLKRRGGLNREVIWEVSDVVDFVFPRIYQPTYHRVAVDLVKLLLEKGTLDKTGIKTFLEKNRYSKATLENKVIPKLVRFGLVKREREIQAVLGRGRPLVLTPSLTFSNYLERIGFAWNMLVSTARKKERDGVV